MLKFILGTAGTGKTTYCLEEIKKRLLDKQAKNNIFLLLPEHMTFQIERQLAVMLENEGGFTRAFIYGFRRFCYTLLNLEGGALKPHLSDVGKNLLLRRIVSEHKRELSVLRKAIEQRHFTTALAEVIKELKTYGIMPDELQEAAEKLADKALQKKIADIVILL